LKPPDLSDRAAAGEHPPTWEDGTEVGAKPEARPIIRVDEDMTRVVNEAIAALATEPTVFQRTGSLVHMVRYTADRRSGLIQRRLNAPLIAFLPEAVLRVRLSASAEWRKSRRKDKAARALPPPWAVSAVHSLGTWQGIRQLEGIIEAPVLRADGSLLAVPGYDAATGLLFLPNAEFLPVSAIPTLDEAKAACAQLRDLVLDFPFARDEHRSAWLAALLTPFVRGALPGPAPGFLLDANTRGSGKGLLADLISIIVTGRELARATMPTEEAELRKVLFAIALEGDQLVLMDEAHVVGGASLDAVLTGVTIKDRILGESRRPEAPIRFTFFVAGNNVQVRGDTIRRLLPIRLCSRLERPEERTDFKYPNVKEFARNERPRLLKAALTILCGYCAAGRPNMNLPSWGSFEEWSGFVRSALVWAGEKDPCAGRADLADADPEVALLRQLFCGFEELGPGSFTVRQLLDAAEQKPASVLKAALLELSEDKLNPVAIGNRLRRFKGRVVDDKFLECERDRNSVGHWRVANAGAAGTAGAIPNPRARESLDKEIEEGREQPPHPPQPPHSSGDGQEGA
jgi:hypothetical protein